MGELPRNSAVEVKRLRDLPYPEYLETVWWKRRRYARLLKARGKCERCGVVTTFQDVHHVYYDRRGAERDSDLEVLCRACHEGHHFDESRKQHIGQYIMVARETVVHDHPESTTDFKEAFRERCRGLGLVTTDHRFDDAITAILDERGVSLSRTPQRHPPPVSHDEPPIDKREAIDLMRKIGLQIPFKSFPVEYGAGTGLVAIKARGDAWVKAQRCPQCQRTGPQLSGVQLGWLYCAGCQHRWELPAELYLAGQP